LIIEARQRGRARVLRRKKFSPDGAFDLAFALCENQVTLLVDSGQGWRPMLTERSRIRQNVDFRQPDVLHQYRYAWEGDSSGVIGVQAGLFGQMGLRDPHLVEHSDGRPFTQDGRHFLSWTCAGLGFFPQAHWSVWSFDPATPEEMRLESKLFFARDGLILGDHAGHVVRDGDRWHIAVSAWGDFPEGPIHVRHLSTDADVLSGVHLLPTAPTPLPTQFGAWDPGLLRCGDRWHVSFVESESQTPFVFRPALASTTNEDWTCALEAVPLHGEFRQCEGPIFSRVADRTWLLASDGEARQYPVFSLDGRRAGRLQAPYLTNIPHPQLVADPRGGWWLVTFDGTQFAENVLGYGGHGDLVVMHTV
jgi:hypothetical protein